MQNLKNKSINLIKNSTLVRYIMTGGTAYILEMAVLLSLSEVFKLNSTVAISIAFWLGLIISFFMQKVLAFQNTNTKPEEISSQGIYYGLLVIFNFIFTLIFTNILAPVISLA
ncbi:MAG: GtrA family protein, partial [Candidatus Sacchiramonaceae bacterium]|nr:GtrA family protein [Candidatus Saccharimonadaceae bacterium]